MDRNESAGATPAHPTPLAPAFIHIPGPNPILVSGEPGSWDDGVIEACDVLKDLDTYYLYYHGTSSQTGYQVGLATAQHPLGSWRKHGSEPVLPLGPPGSWDSVSVACAALLKEGADRYYMWYSARGSEEATDWSIGLATADSPLGPWAKHAANPLLPGFGYVGGVVKADGRYLMYCEHPIGSTGPDYGPIALATADAPEGPWTPHPQNPVLRQGEWGEWDDGGFSEARVLYQGGLFHLFYGGAKLHPTRIRSTESIGYAWSTDGVHFTKHPLNPAAPRERDPNSAAFAEVHSYIEPPFIYAYHTLRYNDRPGAEDLGVQVLATTRPFRLTMPLLCLDSLAAGARTALSDARRASLSSVTTCALTIECRFSAEARSSLRVEVYASRNGLQYDTRPVQSMELGCCPGGLSRQTVDVVSSAAFLTVCAENPDPWDPVTDLQIWATLGG